MSQLIQGSHNSAGMCKHLSKYNNIHRISIMRPFTGQVPMTWQWSHYNYTGDKHGMAMMTFTVIHSAAQLLVSLARPLPPLHFLQTDVIGRPMTSVCKKWRGGSGLASETTQLPVTQCNSCYRIPVYIVRHMHNHNAVHIQSNVVCS